MKHELEIPEGYEVISSRVNDWQTLDEGEKVIVTVLKKQTVKDFDWYVDEYLTNKNGSTIDTITNLIKDHILESVRNLIKEKNYSLVPWEIKIGLFRFICEQNKMDSDDIVGFVVHYKASLCTEFGSSYIGYSVSKICSYEFLSDVLEIKQNKN